MDHFVALVGHLAWPLATLIVLYLVREELRQVARSIARRISDPSTDVSIGSGGLEIRATVGQPDNLSDQLIQRVHGDPAFERELRRWIQEKGLNVSVTSFVYGEVYDSLRRAAAKDLL